MYIIGRWWNRLSLKLGGSELTSLNRKKRQRKLNRLIRKINNMIAQNKKYNGNYYITQQAGSQFHYFPDRSGAALIVGLTFHNRKTGFSRTYYSDYWEFLNGMPIYNKMNDFIIKNEYGV